MASGASSESRLNFRLSSELKSVIEEAAALLGQSVSDYAISTLVSNARLVLQQSASTELSDRDRDRFIAALDDAEGRPNEALRQAAKRYKKRMR